MVDYIKNCKIVIIDSGVQTDHPAFKGEKITGAGWKNGKMMEGEDGVPRMEWQNEHKIWYNLFKRNYMEHEEKILPNIVYGG